MSATVGGCAASALLVLCAFAPSVDRSFASSRAPAGDGGLAEAKRDLVDRYPDKRRSAVRRLVEIGTEESWTLVVPALRDPDALVADEAQLRLAAVPHAKVWARVLGSDALGHKNVLVRKRTAELIGRRPTPAHLADLLRAAGDKDPGVRRMAVWSVERQAAAQNLEFGDEARQRGALAAIGERDRDPCVRGAVLFALAALAQSGRSVPELVPRLESAARSKAREERTVAAALLATHHPARAGALLAPLARDELPVVRAAAIRAIVECRDRRAVEVLVERLEHEPRIRLRRMAAAGLERLSGRKARLDHRPFRDWLATLPEDWRAELGAPATAVEGGTTSAALYGMPILSDHFAVLIDMSGSMWTAKNGVVPKTLVDQQVRKLVEGLGESARFNLVPYATQPTRLWEQLDVASKRNAERAVEWFEQLTLRGKGNLWDALDLALEDPAPDTLILFHDGAPTGGPHWNMELLEPLLAERNRYSGIVLDVVLTEGGAQKRRWRSIAEASGGEYYEVKS